MPLEIQLLEDSFAEVEPQAEAFSASFYKNLFRANPSVQELFAKTSLEAQEKKLIASLALIVENLRNPEALQRALESLGVYHVKTGTLTKHYPLVGNALLETSADFLGDRWTSAKAQAWLNAYNLICEMMLQGAEHPERYLDGELTFYEWLDLYGESSPALQRLIASLTHYQYRAEK